MKFLSFAKGDQIGLAVEADGRFRGYQDDAPEYPGQLYALIQDGPDAVVQAGKVLSCGPEIDLSEIRYLPPIAQADKFICVGLNYRAHTEEGPYEQPDFPTLFARFSSSFVGHEEPILRPAVSEQLDFEGELVAVIGKRARNVSVDEALDYVAGYSIFNDGSIRNFQRRTPQWTPGKNFDGTGPFGPYYITADELPAGCRGLRLQTRLNGKVVQDALIDDMVFPVDQLVSICSSFMTLHAGDVLITGTPSGVGHARKPQLWMKDGDVCEVEIDQIGILSNPVKNA